MNKYLKYSFSNRKIIEKIVPVKEWNTDCHKDNIIKVKYGYVMPLYHGYDWKAKKQDLIDKYTY